MSKTIQFLTLTMLKGVLPAETLNSMAAPGAIFNEETAILSLDTNGLEIQATDYSRVGWANISLSESAFTSFKATTGKLGIHINKLASIADLLRKSSSEATIAVDSATNKLQVASNTINFSGILRDIENVPRLFRDPDLDPVAEIHLSGDALNSPVELTEKLTTHLKLRVHPDNPDFCAKAEGDTDRFHMAVTSEVVFHQTDAFTFQSKFAIDYFRLIQTTIPDNTEVQITLAGEGPVVFTYPIADGHGEVEFVLRPSIG